MRTIKIEETKRPTRLEKGNRLCRRDQRLVLEIYQNRFTGEYKPAWVVASVKEDGVRPPVQFNDDKEWLRNTLFPILKNGRLDVEIHYCHSTPTWPRGTASVRVARKAPLPAPLMILTFPALKTKRVAA